MAYRNRLTGDTPAGGQILTRNAGSSIISLINIGPCAMDKSISRTTFPPLNCGSALPSLFVYLRQIDQLIIVAISEFSKITLQGASQSFTCDEFAVVLRNIPSRPHTTFLRTTGRKSGNQLTLLTETAKAARFRGGFRNIHLRTQRCHSFKSTPRLRPM